jgi:PAS domain S-box-containing protein
MMEIQPRLLHAFRKSAPVRYATGIAAAVASILLRASLAPIFGDHFPLLLAFVAVVFVAAYCGLGPAIAAALAAAIASAILFHEHRLLPDRESFGLITYLIATFMVIALVEALRRARLHADNRLAELREESARREREQAVSAQLRAIVESSGDAIASMDLTGTITSWNRAAEGIFGYSAAHAIGLPISILTPADRAAEEDEAIAQIRAGGSPRPFETVRLHKNGTPIEVSLTMSPIHNPRGGVCGVSYIARDITERKQFEQRLQQKQKLESLGVMAGGLAHDFNNVLTGIMGNTSLVMQTLADPASRERLNSVLRASDHAALLVRQMLAFAGKGAVAIRRLDLSHEIEEMNPLLRTMVAHSIALDFHLAGGLPPVEADLSQVKQLVMNLVINAAESIDERGAISISTSVREQPSGACVVLEVCDTGNGMDEATKARIFDPFFTTKFTGRGLGLAAVMGIIRSHRGEIEVESERGRGSTFRVILPAVSRETSEVMQ